MKRKRRVELHIERREISVFAGAGMFPGQSADLPRQDGTGLLPASHFACPTCGAVNMILLTDAVSSSGLDLAALNQGMQNGSVHFHRAPSGEWWICTKSFHQS